MANATFNVSGCSGSSCIMTTSSPNANNNGNATVKVGNSVLWNKTGNTLTSFSIAVNKGTDSDIWGDTPPAPFPNATSKNWKGTVQFVGDGGENYTITCTCDGNSSSHDPRITVNQ